MRLKDKIAVVTGAASGIGKEIATAYLREGARVAIADLDLKAGQAAARELDNTGTRTMAVAMDVTQEDQVEAGMAQVIKAYGGIDVVIHFRGRAEDRGERLAGRQRSFQLLQRHGGGDADHDRVRCQRIADLPGQIRDAHGFDAQDHDAGACGRLFVVLRLFLAGDGRNAVMPFGEFVGAFGTADRGDDVRRVGAARDQAAHDGLVH